MTSDEFFDLCDCQQAVNGKDLSLTVAETLKETISSSITGRFLGLAAGWGIAEQDLAVRFGFADITLVDKNPPKIPDFQGHYLSSDLFTFLDRERKLWFSNGFWN